MLAASLMPPSEVHRHSRRLLPSIYPLVLPYAYCSAEAEDMTSGTCLTDSAHSSAQVTASVAPDHDAPLRRPQRVLPLSICIINMVRGLFHSHAGSRTPIPGHPARLLGWAVWLYIRRQLGVRCEYLDRTRTTERGNGALRPAKGYQGLPTGRMAQERTGQCTMG